MKIYKFIFFSAPKTHNKLLPNKNNINETQKTLFIAIEKNT